jgi:hypothetical protein
MLLVQGQSYELSLQICLWAFCLLRLLAWSARHQPEGGRLPGVQQGGATAAALPGTLCMSKRQPLCA